MVMSSVGDITGGDSLWWDGVVRGYWALSDKRSLVGGEGDEEDELNSLMNADIMIGAGRARR